MARQDSETRTLSLQHTLMIYPTKRLPSNTTSEPDSKVPPSFGVKDRVALDSVFDTPELETKSPGLKSQLHHLLLCDTGTWISPL